MKDKKSVDCLIVGAGPAGLAAYFEQKKETGSSVLLLDSQDRLGGRIADNFSLHLSRKPIDSSAFIEIAKVDGTQVKLEGQWHDFSEAVFKSDDWHHRVPQWDLYKGGELYAYKINPEAFLTEPKERKSPEDPIEYELAQDIVLFNPVTQIQELESSLGYSVTTPTLEIECRKLIWAAGERALENCLGKEELRPFMVASPAYDEEAREARGGISLCWNFSDEVELLEELPQGKLLAMPVKHEKKYFLALILPVQDQKRQELRSLVYLSDDYLKSPKQLLSFQKSLRRVLKTFFKDFGDTKIHESLVESPRLKGHALGMPWVLKDKPTSNMRIIGDETLAAVLDDGRSMEFLAELSGPVRAETVKTPTDAASEKKIDEKEAPEA